MSTSENHHAIAAQNHSGMEEGERAIEATLAVAYEQRTANLLSLRIINNQIIASGTRLDTEALQKLADLDEQIKERLGLK